MGLTHRHGLNLAPKEVTVFVHLVVVVEVSLPLLLLALLLLEDLLVKEVAIVVLVTLLSGEETCPFVVELFLNGDHFIGGSRLECIRVLVRRLECGFWLDLALRPNFHRFEVVAPEPHNCIRIPRKLGRLVTDHSLVRL